MEASIRASQDSYNKGTWAEKIIRAGQNADDKTMRGRWKAMAGETGSMISDVIKKEDKWRKNTGEMLQGVTMGKDQKSQLFGNLGAIMNAADEMAVDMGLSVKWASCDLGAVSANDEGWWFNFASLQPRQIVGMNYYDEDYLLPAELPEDISGTEFDAATYYLGGKWRMPSDEEFTELREKCTWTWVEQNGINGYIVKGPNDNTIFMPIGGYMNGTSLTNADLRGYYWSSSIDLIRNRFDRTCIVSFDSSKVSKVYSYRRFGLPIRPVYDDRVE